MHTVSNALFRDDEIHSATQSSERITHFSKVQNVKVTVFLAH